MTGVEEGAGLAVAAAAVTLMAMYYWVTQGAPAATKFLNDVRDRVNESFADSDPSGTETCRESEEYDNLVRGSQEPSPPEPSPPGGAPDPGASIAATAAAAALLYKAMGTGKTPVMDPTLSPADQQLWKKCSQLYDTYKDTQRSVADRASRMNELADRLNQNKGSSQDKLDLCLLLDEQIEETQRLHRQRKEYVDNGCDKFDWFNDGRTEQARRAAHEGEMENVDKQIKNLFALKEKFCS